MRKKLAMLMASLFLVLGTAWAQAPVATPQEAITGLLNRIGGNGAAEKFEIVIDANLAENGKDVFVITSQNGKPCIKGNTQLSVATGINWYLNHYAHINLTWNNLTTDLSKVTLPVPGGVEKHVCNAPYRYDFNTCTFSYSMAFWTWERWQQEIDWMALHGINAPLNLVGLEVVTRNFLEELDVSETDIDNYIAGPGFMAWFAMNNLEGWGSTINAKDVTMNGNPDWWYTRQEQLCRNMMQRMRELGMQPVIPGFSGQVPYALNNYTTITGFNKGDIVNAGSWGGGFTHPGVVNPSTDSYKNLADIYYKHLHDVMGISEFYSIDPFHEMSAPVSPNVLYPGIMAHLDRCYALESDEDRARFNAPAQPKWIVQQWQGTPVSGAFSAMSSYGDRFIGLDLFADAPGKAQWNGTYYQGRPYIFCMLHNFGGRSGMHGRLESTMKDYFRALAKNNNCQGIGATPEGSETNPILYDMLFELPWMDVNNRPTADEWLEDYAYSRYGVQNEKALEALKNLKKSVWACPTDQQGTSEAVILARPKWEVKSVSTWSTSAIYWDPQDVLQAADGLYSIKDIVTENGGQDGVANYNYDFIDVVRQAMVDYAAELLPLIKAAHDKGDNTEYTRLYKLYLQLMLDLDTMLSYDAGFKLERWTSLARNIADEVKGTDVNDRNWLEWNARTQVTVWAGKQDALNDYSNRCWAGLIKDFHYERWKYFFENNGAAPGGNWYSGFERPWTVNFTDYDYSEITIPNDMTATEKAAETFGKYFGRVMGATKNYIFPMGVTRDATKSDAVAEVNRGQVVELPLEVGKDVTITNVWVDLNNDGAASNSENLAVTDGNKVAIAADAAIGKTTAKVTYDDGTVITFGLALVEEITEARAVTAVAGENGSVAIEGTNELSITNTAAVKMTATANTGYNFENWTMGGEVVSNDNPFIYYGKEAATFTANFIQNKWGVVECAPDVDGAGKVKDEAAVMSDVSNNNQYIHKLTLAYYNREAETIYEPTTAPTSIFTTIPQIVNVPQGASFTVEYDKGISNQFQHCYFRAYIDLNADGDFDDEGELLKEVGSKGAQNTAVCSNSINVLLPYTMPLGITHMRLRFDSAWNIGDGAKAKSVRPVYDLVINVTEGSDKAAHITVASNNDAWGTVKVWTNETPADITATEWDVTKGVPFFIAATKASDDVEFLGWYDQYGRLLTNELEYSMLAREDATYTARFRKALDIDGWEFEYRTEPGDELRVKGTLAKGVKPEAGKTYYIAADAKQSSGNFVSYYLYDNSGTLKTSKAANGNSYLWTCIVNNDGTYSFQNASGKYLANDGNHFLSIGATPAKYAFETANAGTGVALTNVSDGYTGSKWMVTKFDGSAFNKNSVSVNNGSWCNDYIFVELTPPDVVILTSVRKSGDHDLDIPETVEILGEQCKIVGFDNNLFNNNKDLWTISLPSTIEFLSEKSLLNGTMTGKVASGAGTTNAANYTVYNLEETIKVTDGFKVTVSGTSDGSTFNEWGSGLFATGTNPLAAKFDDGFQFYLAKAGNFVLKVDNGDKEYALDNANCKVSAGTPFTATIEYKNNTITITVDNGAGQTGVYTRDNVTLANISAFSAAIPTGITLNVNVETYNESDPFEGCANLFDITVADGCSYYVADNKLYNTGNYALHTLTDEDKAEEIRALGELIDNTEALMDIITTSINPVGKATGLALTTTQGSDFYVSSNADQNTGGGSSDGGGIAALVDNNEGTYFHTRWGGTVVNEPHYIQVDLGANNLMNYFKFTYKPRNGSPAPTAMTVYGSNDGVNFTDVLATINSGLPAHNSGTTYESAAIDSKRYRYLRFTVTGSAGPGNAQYGGQYFFGMLEFDLFKLTSTVEVADDYKNLAKITNDETANVYDNLVNALYVYNNGGTAAELQAAYDVLKPLYDALNEKKNALQYINQLTELIGNTEALINVIAASVDPVGKATEITLSTTQGQSNYIWCNAPQAGSSVGSLLDNNAETYFHSNWQSTTAPADGLDHHLTIENLKGIIDLKFRYQGRSGSNLGDYPTTIKVQGSNNGTDYTDIAIVQPRNANGGTIGSGAEWTSERLGDGNNYTYLRFMVTATTSNRKADGHIYWHMAEFDLFKLTSVVEVASGYKTLGGITNEEATAAYDLMVAAQYLCNNGGTVAELKATLTALQTAYDALNAKQGTVLNGVFHISFMNGDTEVPMFIGYNEKQDDWVGDDHKGYKILGTDVYTTDVEAGKVFTIIPQENGYNISAQGKYLKAIDFNNWRHIQFSDDESAAGLYLFHETSLAGIFKIQGVGESDGDWVHNDYWQVYNENGEMIVGPNPEGDASSFALTPATSYAINVPENGLLPLYLPFNVVLPVGMEAFDINDLSKEVLVTAENLLVKIAGAGETVLAGTPVVVKAAPGTHTLAITMDSDGAKTSLEGSVLRGNYAKQNLGIQLGFKKFVLNGKVWENIDNSREIPANSCWIEVVAEDLKDDYIDMDPDFVEINDWKFRYEAATNGIKLTYHVENDQETDLVIPEEITIDGVPQKVVAISPDFLHGSTKVTSVKFPASLVNLGFRTVEPMFGDETTVYEGYEGDGGVYDGPNEVSSVGAHRKYDFPIDPATGESFKVDSKSAWRLTLDVTIDDPDLNFNNYGSAIVSTNENTLADSYTDGDMQIYMKAEHKQIIVKIDNADDRYTYTLPKLDAEGKETGELVAHDHFVFELEHDGTGGYQVVIYYDDGRAKMYNISASEGAVVKNFSSLYYSLPKGIRVKVKVDKLISQGLFVGCTNLHEIIVDENNPTFMACDHGVLYDKNQYYVMRIPEGETSHHFEIPSKVVKLYAGSFHGVNADIVLHSNPQIGVVPGHEAAVKDANFFLSLDDKDNTITENETGYGGARDFISTNKNTYQLGRYKRAPLAAGVYGTIVLPFAPTNWKEKYDFFEMTDADATSFHFSPVDELVPNTAYLYKLKDNPGEMTMKDGLDVFETETGVPFTVQPHDKYNPKDETPGGFRALGAYVNYYIETKNYPNRSYYYYNTAKEMFVKVTNKLTYRPYRALFVVTPEEGQAAQAPAQLSLRIRKNDGSTTEIDPSQVEGFAEPEYYDLMGRRVLNPTNGVYIVNGEKVVIE